jgi:lipopolysaccharide transport system permease protein
VEVRIYKSAKQYSIWTVLKDGLEGYKESFYLAKQLAKRDISAQYRQSYLGIFWAMVPILMNSFLWIFLSTTNTVKLSATSIPYPLYVVIGSTLWSLLGDSLTLTMTSINENRSIITKINFQKEALVTLGVIKFFFNLSIKFLLIILFLFLFKVSPSISFIAFVPMLLTMILFFISIGIILTPIGILYQDINRLIPHALQVLMFFTPVLYAIPNNRLMATIMKWNPLTYLICDLRNCLTGFPIENGLFFVFLAIVTIICTFFAIIIYRISMPIITERMSA